MSNYFTTDTELTTIADAIRTKGGTSASLVYPSGFVSAINDISGGGSDTRVKEIVEGTITTLSDSSITKVRAFGFQVVSSLTSVNLPSCEYIDGYAFYGCSSLASVSLPACEVISNNAFQSCTALSEIYVGTSSSRVCQLGQSNAFSGCTSLTSIYVPTSLTESYKTASNWSVYSDKIVGI